MTATAVGPLFSIAMWGVLRRNVIRSATGLILLGVSIPLRAAVRDDLARRVNPINPPEAEDLG